MMHLSFALLLALAACSGDKAPATPEVSSPAAAALDPQLIQASWPVRMAADAVRAPFEQSSGWGSYFGREHVAALAAFAATPAEARALARQHAEIAALYRQAALLASHAVRHVYGTDRQETDPPQVDYLLAAASGVAGDCPGAHTLAEKLTAGPDLPFAAGLSWWRDWSARAGCPGAYDFPAGTFVGQPGDVVLGQSPDAGALPHFRFRETGEGAREVETADPSTLLALSLWHERAALAAAPPEDKALVRLVIAPWALPGEAAPTESLPEKVDDAWLFGSFALVPSDIAFLAVARKGGVGAVEEWKDRSALAAVLAPTVREGKVDVDAVLLAADATGRSLEAAMATAAGGNEVGFHRTFADFARLAVIRAGVIAADANPEQYRDAGVLRVNAFERSTGPVGDPVFLMSLAAWDVGNRSPLRAQDIMHSLSTQYAALATARYPLDALHIRLGRNAAPATPVH
jgi:hypothetical protein